MWLRGDRGRKPLSFSLWSSGMGPLWFLPVCHFSKCKQIPVRFPKRTKTALPIPGTLQGSSLERLVASDCMGVCGQLYVCEVWTAGRFVLDEI